MGWEGEEKRTWEMDGEKVEESGREKRGKRVGTGVQ